MKIERKWAMPSKNTFTIKPIQELLIEELEDQKLIIDPFANNNKEFATITNDLNPNFNTDYHLPALEFLKKFEDNSVDCVLYDPPYSVTQVKECYEGIGLEVTAEETRSSFYTKHKAEIARVVKKGGKVISFGWNSGGIGKKIRF